MTSQFVVISSLAFVSLGVYRIIFHFVETISLQNAPFNWEFQSPATFNSTRIQSVESGTSQISQEGCYPCYECFQMFSLIFDMFHRFRKCLQHSSHLSSMLSNTVDQGTPCNDVPKRLRRRLIGML